MGELDQTIKDPVGYSTLATIADANLFNKWMYETIAPFCKGEILEIGGGIGNISYFFLKNGNKLTISELLPEYCLLLKEKFRHFTGLRDVIQLNIVDPDFDSLFKDYFKTFDTVFALNVIEHVEDQDLAIKNCRKLLVEGGTLVILVPAFQNFYNHFDKELGHFIRFSKARIKGLIKNNSFDLIHWQYFNAAGIAGWWFTGSVLKKKMIPEGSMKLYNQLVPLFKMVDVCTKRFLGLSLIAVGKCTGDAIS
jgi:2-polyprenyl-3-methyl-5-hydroxy-6-metoxy-1,4-benzoquinol methylase